MQDTKPVAMIISSFLQHKDDALFRQECAIAYACILDKLPLETFYTDADQSGLEVMIDPTPLACKEYYLVPVKGMSSHGQTVYATA